MKKPLLLSSLVGLIAGFGLALPANPIRFQTPLAAINDPVQTIPEPDTPTQTTVELLNAGAEPRRPIQFSIPANLKQTTILTMSTDMAISLDGRVMPRIKLPVVAMTLDVEGAPIEESGDTAVEFVYSAVDFVVDEATSPIILGMLRSQLESLVGFGGSYVISNQGVLLESQLDLGGNLNSSIEPLIQQMLNAFIQSSTLPLPEAALGPGAQWRAANREIATGIIPIQGVQTYELVDFQENTVTLNFVTDFQSTPQTGEDILPEMLSELANMSVKSLNVQGDGSLTLALDQVMPIHSTLSIVSDGLYGVVMPDDREEVPMTIQSQMDLKIESQ